MTIKIKFPKRAYGRMGQVHIEAEHMVGNSCDVATRTIRDALGRNQQIDRKPEFEDQEQIVTEVNENVG